MCTPDEFTFAVAWVLLCGYRIFEQPDFLEVQTGKQIDQQRDKESKEKKANLKIWETSC